MHIESKSSEEHEQRLDEVLAAYLKAVEAGQVHNRGEWLAHHPQFAAELGEFFADQNLFERSVAALLRTVDAPLGDFRILREVGRGGMGIVYEAEQISLGRRVALKVLPFAATMDPRQLQRFQNESRAAATLEHPHIVPVYGVGCERGVHYYAMKFIDGRSLAAMIEARKTDHATSSTSDPKADHAPCNVAIATVGAEAPTERAPHNAGAFRQSAEWGIQAAEALEHSHSVGIVHRDIKPANLMIDGKGKLWVTDFGLARTAGDAGMTMTGDVLGTLRYMSPEQALAKHGLVDHRTDIYSLGVSLYELLTGAPAVKGNDREQILNAIMRDGPRPPREFDAAIPQDLETIVLKALEKNCADRYSSALALAEDLRRFLDGEPVRAKRPNALQRVKRWSRRHGPAVLTGTIVLLFALGFLAVGILALWLKDKEKNEALGLAQQARQRAEESEASLRHHLYAPDMKLAYEEWQKGYLLLTLDRLERHRPVGDQEDLRGFEWYYLQRLCHAEMRTLRAHKGGANTVSYSHDGRHLATAGEDGTIKIWAADTGVLQSTIHAHDRPVTFIQFSPAADMLASASADATAKIWDVATGKLRVTISKPGERVLGVAFLPARVVAAASLQEKIEVWDINAPETAVALGGSGDGFQSLRGSPDGKTIATGSCDGAIKLWDWGTGDLRLTMTGHSGPVRDVVFSNDSRKLASAGADGTVRIWDVSNGTKQAIFHGHADSVQTVAFSPDDGRLASGGLDNIVRVWSLSSLCLVNSLHGHTGRIWDLQFAPDRKTLASASSDGTVKLWDTVQQQEGQSFHECTPQVRRLAFSPDGQTLAAGTENGTVQLLDRTGSRPAVNLATHDTPVGRLVFSRDGTLATSWGDGSVQLWDRSSKNVLRLPGEGVMPSAVALSPDGRTLATGMGNGTVRLRDSATGHVLGDLLTTKSVGFLALAFAPDGLTLACGAPDGEVWLWGVEKRQLVQKLNGLRGLAEWLVYSPDGKFLAGADFRGNITIWDLATGGEPDFTSHKRNLKQIVFSPDGRTLASAGGNELILWNVVTGQEMIHVQDPGRDIWSVAFSPDGQILGSAGSVVRRSVPQAKIGEVCFWLAPRDEVTPESGSPPGRRAEPED
jgi:WD40 repeat protein/serine/threonine protein kinase